MGATKVILLLFFTISVVSSQRRLALRGSPVLATDCVDETEVCTSATNYDVCYGGMRFPVACDRATPYCSIETSTTIKCVAQQPVQPLNCPGEGHFPDPTRCDVFHFCVGTGTVNDVSYDCASIDSKAVYDPKLQACVRMSATSPCHKFNCQSKFFSAYPGDRSVYALCKDNVPVMLRRCPGSQEFQEDTRVCDIPCRAEGRIPLGPSSPAEFYACVSNGSAGQFLRQKGQCPTGYEFNPMELVCTKMIVTTATPPSSTISTISTTTL